MTKFLGNHDDLRTDTWCGRVILISTTEAYGVRDTECSLFFYYIYRCVLSRRLLHCGSGYADGSERLGVVGPGSSRDHRDPRTLSLTYQSIQRPWTAR